MARDRPAVVGDEAIEGVDGDGWAIASHITVSTLMSMFPFLILITAIAASIGSSDLADEVARIQRRGRAKFRQKIAGEIHSVLTTALATC